MDNTNPNISTVSNLDRKGVDHKALVTDHINWLSHPTTHLLLKALDNHERSIVDALIKSTGASEEAEGSAYYHSITLKTTRAISMMVKNSETFITKALLP